MSKLKTGLLVLLSAFLQGCGGIYESVVAPQVDYYYLSPARDISSIGKVVIVEFDNYTTAPEVSAEFTGAVYQAVAKKNLFGLDVIYRSDPAYGRLQLDGSSGIDLERLSRIRKSLEADGVIVGSVMQYRSFPRMAVGLRLKLLDLRDGRLIWAIEQVWDTTDKSVEEAVKRFFRARMRSGYEPLGWRLAVVSPRAFRKFVAWRIARTMP